MLLSSLNILIVTPAPRDSLKGNRITALRWEQILHQLGHQAALIDEYQDEECDVLVTLHALKCHPSIVRSMERNPERPIILALTGTDLYGDIHTSKDAKQSLDLATRMIVLQEKGLDQLSAEHRKKTHVIYQSVPKLENLPEPREDVFEVCVVGHMREVKDPFRAAEAARLLPSESKIRILQIGSALNDEMAQRAEQEQKENPRFEWLGEMPWVETLQVMARCRLLILSSRSEGGANAVSEALACSLPVISSRIDGTTGILGEDYPGYYSFGDTEALAEMMRRAEVDSAFY